ncbi:ABC transporter ATP-binding protein [Dyella sp. A6]|uniref:ABC transporter ATP-binding protein n=1 Tax=Dyella aluminiiresistens TaxID=3069105 RepID=UPI002E79598F|nr:ABC transporter ATP-binding protein [Dyella sp. A6]
MRDPEGGDEATASTDASSGDIPPDAKAEGLLAELAQLAAALRKLFGAQLHLLAAELGLARRAVSWLLTAGLVATIAGVGLALSLLGLIGVLLASWFHSWIAALLVLVLLQALCLAGAVLLFRRCMHWMSLPATRGEWHAMMRETRQRADRRIADDAAAQSDGGTRE